MSKLAQRQRNLAARQFNGSRRTARVAPLKVYTVKNVGTRKTVQVTAVNEAHAFEVALAEGLAKSVTKLVVV
jgi:hypothetical protein